MQINLHARLARSLANGPGIRAVLWFQGCTLACPGCYNPETHHTAAHEVLNVSQIMDWLQQLTEISGVTISGGEPLQQLEGLTNLLTQIRLQTTLSTVVFTGYTWREIRQLPDQAFLNFFDVLISGRYLRKHRTANDLRGSANKRYHFLSTRYTVSDFTNLSHAEVLIGTNGRVTASGIDPLQLR